jgi:hypothetical protein
MIRLVASTRAVRPVAERPRLGLARPPNLATAPRKDEAGELSRPLDSAEHRRCRFEGGSKG